MGSKNKKDDTFDPSLLTKDQGGWNQFYLIF